MTAICYDVFISHAYEDNNSFANELAFTLKEKGLKIFYSGFELNPGDGITESLNLTLKTAIYGIVIISPVFLKKRWAMKELNVLLARKNEHTRILPILHDITKDEIKEHLPLSARRRVVSSKSGLKVIVNKTMKVILKKYAEKRTGKESGFGKNKNPGSIPSESSNTGFITLGGMPVNNYSKPARKKKRPE
jgi:hypothetical protein